MPSAAPLPAGFEVPVYRTALRTQLVLGAPRQVAAILSAGAGFGFLWKVWVLLPLVGILWAFAAWGCRIDEKWFEKAWQTVKYKKYYKA